MRMILPLAVVLLVPFIQASDVDVADLSLPIRSEVEHNQDSAVIIGIEDYYELPDVQYADRDAGAFYDLMVYTRRVPTERIRRVQKANREKIIEAVTAAGKETPAGGVVWIYYAGHGAGSPDDGSRMFVGIDAQADITSFKSRSVKVSDLTRLATSGGGQVMLVADTCYTGAGRNNEVLIPGARIAVPESMLTTTTPRVQEWVAASAGQVASPLPSVEHGAFTYFTITAMRGAADGELDGKRDGNISAEEMKLWVSRKLRENQIGDEQTPVMVGGTGSFQLTSGLPEEVRGADVVVPKQGQPTAVRPAAKTASQPTATTVKPEEKGHLGGGFELGTLSGFKIEGHSKPGATIESIGIRVVGGFGLAYFYSPAIAGGAMVSIDRKTNNENIDIQINIGGGILSSSAAFFIGAGYQYDPPSAFQVTLGSIFAIGGSPGIIPDVSVGFVW